MPGDCVVSQPLDAVRLQALGIQRRAGPEDDAGCRFLAQLGMGERDHCDFLYLRQALQRDFDGGVPTNPVVIRRVTALLAKAGLIATRPGASGGSWLLRRPEDICLDEVLRAVNGCAQLGSPPAGAKGCPVGQHIPRQVAKALTAADQAAGAALSKITIADLLAEDPEVLRPFAPHPCCPNADAA